jgi:hypothetical protein
LLICGGEERGKKFKSVVGGMWHLIFENLIEEKL